MNHLIESVIEGFGRKAGEELWRFFRRLAGTGETGEDEWPVDDIDDDDDDDDDGQVDADG